MSTYWYGIRLHTYKDMHSNRGCHAALECEGYVSTVAMSYECIALPYFWKSCSGA